MKIFILFSFFLIAISLISKNLFSSAKRNLFKDQAAWSGKDIKIKHSASRQVEESKGNYNYLQMISDESKSYLEDQSNKDNNSIN